MKKASSVKRVVLALLIMLSLICACSSDQEPPAPPDEAPTNDFTIASDYEPQIADVTPGVLNPTEPQELEDDSLLRVEISVEAGGEPGWPEFTVKTNLPDETELILTLKSKENSTAIFQDKVTVENGIAKSGAFASKTKPLSGEFSLGISSGLARLQSDAVRSVIGDVGENITGPDVVKAEVGEDNCISAIFNCVF